MFTVVHVFPFENSQYNHFTSKHLNILPLLGVRVRSHRAKATSLRWVLSISIVLFTLSESESDITNEWVHDPF